LFIASSLFAIVMSILLSMPGANIGRHGTAVGLLLFALGVSAWQLMLMAVGTRPAAASMMAHLFFIFFLIVPALFQLSTQTYALDMSVYKPEIATRAAGIVLLFIIFFMGGGALGPKRLEPALRTISSCEQHRRGTFVIAFVLIAAAVTLAAILGLD
jgi:hypothetical protein